MCGSRARARSRDTTRATRPREIRERAARPGDRVGDAEREEVVTLLRDAGGEGFLAPDELADRTGRALAACTAGELGALTDDLPDRWREDRRRARRRHTRAARSRRELAAHLRAYTAVMALLVGIWLTVALTGGGWYPWPVWPALGWGIALAHRGAGARRALPRPAPRTL